VKSVEVRVGVATEFTEEGRTLSEASTADDQRVVEGVGADREQGAQDVEEVVVWSAFVVSVQCQQAFHTVDLFTSAKVLENCATYAVFIVTGSSSIFIVEPSQVRLTVHLRVQDPICLQVSHAGPSHQIRLSETDEFCCLVVCCNKVQNGAIAADHTRDWDTVYDGCKKVGENNLGSIQFQRGLWRLAFEGHRRDNCGRSGDQSGGGGQSGCGGGGGGVGDDRSWAGGGSGHR